MKINLVLALVLYFGIEGPDLLLQIVHLIHARLQGFLIKALVLIVVLLQTCVLVLQVHELLVYVVVVLPHLLHLLKHLVSSGVVLA